MKAGDYISDYKHLCTMRFFLFLSMLLVVGSACRKDGEESGMPPCLKMSVSNEHGCVDRVEEYWFQERKVYKLVVDHCADHPMVVTDAKCNTVCSSGGFAGLSEGPVEEFYQGAQFLRVVWER